MAVQTVAGAPSRIALPQCRTHPMSAPRPQRAQGPCIDLRHLRPAARRTPDFPTTHPGEIDGSRTRPVVTAAQLLLRRDYATIRADGSYGPQTRAAVLAFQTRTGRPVTGVLTPADWAALVSRSEVTLGSRGNAVRAVQMLLNDRLRTAEQIIEDGVLGTGTLMRVQDVQRAAGLPVTRTVDPATFAALLRR
jgi:peptidoglycan hydrolase-like protein with peptidoglycan-binding domain